MELHPLHTAWLQWKVTVLKERVEQLLQENAILRNKIKKRATSIWEMKKAELVEVAMRELNMDREEAEAETVAQLRYIIKNCRELAAMGEEELGVRLPRGLGRMKRKELLEECERRGLATEDPRRPDGLKTREAMIFDIRSQVFATTSTSETPATNPTTGRRTQRSSETWNEEMSETEELGAWEQPSGATWEASSTQPGPASTRASASSSAPETAASRNRMAQLLTRVTQRTEES